MGEAPFDLSKFDPSSFDLSHLHPGEQNRIKNRQFTSQELSLLLSGQNPWTVSGKPKPLPPPPETDTQAASEPPKEQPKAEDEGGTRWPRQARGATRQEMADAELRRFMPEQVRAEYQKADADQRTVIWEANKRAFAQAKKRKEQNLLREQKLMEKVFDTLQRIKEDPESHHLLPPADASTSDLKKWYEEMQKPVGQMLFSGSIDPPSQWTRMDDRVQVPEHPSPFWAVLGFLRKWTALGGVFLLGATWTMIQIDEYALAAVLLLIGMFAFSVQIYGWKGIDNHRKATQILKGVASLLIVGSLVFFGAVIIKKKGTKLWSNLLPERIAPVTPEPSSDPSPPAVTLIRHSGSFFFATYPQPFMYELGDDSLVPIALDLAIAITNNRGTATRITEYTAEIQTRDGAWHRLISLPMSPPRTIFFLNRFDIRRGMKCQLDPPAFDAVADRREIGAGETIQGQMFFELPAELRYETVSYGKLKVTATNIQGEKSEAIFDNPSSPPSTGAGQVNGGFTWCPGEPNQAIDLSRKLIRPLQE